MVNGIKNLQCRPCFGCLGLEHNLWTPNSAVFVCKKHKTSEFSSISCEFLMQISRLGQVIIRTGRLGRYGRDGNPDDVTHVRQSWQGELGGDGREGGQGDMVGCHDLYNKTVNVPGTIKTYRSEIEGFVVVYCNPFTHVYFFISSLANIAISLSVNISKLITLPWPYARQQWQQWQHYW